MFAFIRNFFKKPSPPVIRVWRLGSLEHKMLPTKEAIDRLADILAQDGYSDIIWGPDLSVIELNGDGAPNVIAGPGVKARKVGGTVVFEVE